MKPLVAVLATVALSATLIASDAEAARRLGSGKSVGMQRESISSQRAMTPPAAAPQAPTATNQARAQAPATAAPQPAPKRSWMGPLAGLAAGLGLAALASHFGFGEQLASMLLIGLLVFAVIAVVGMVMRRRSPQLASANAARFDRSAEPHLDEPVMRREASVAPAASASGGRVPADFDAEGFVRQAKVSFLRLQAANDAGNLDDIREFTTPEMFGEIRLALMDRGQSKQETDVSELHAEVVDVAVENARHVVSVRFTGVARIDRGAEIEQIDEIWHIVKPEDGSKGWLLAGIQQLQ